FNINKDCGSTDLAAICAKVREMRADIGIALDGDADRVMIVDERGHVVDGGQLLAVIAESWKDDGRLQRPGVVATVMSNLGLERHLQSLGIELLRTPVGDRYVLERMRSDGYNVGGEPSGHIILTDYTTTGDGFIAALQVLKNVRYKNGAPLENAAVRSAIASAERKLGRGGRLIVRPSGTEPVIRVMGEGDDRNLVELVVDDVVEALSEVAAA